MGAMEGDEPIQEAATKKVSPVVLTVIVLVAGLLLTGLANIISKSGKNVSEVEVVQDNPTGSTKYNLGEVKTEVVTDTMQNDNQITELVIEDMTVGTGAQAKVGDTISVHYTGALLDGTKFDSSVDRGTPYSFELGAGVVIAGWDQGLVGMRVGGKRKLTIPADLAYGNYSPSPLIPANSVLVFDVELLEVK